MENEVPVINRNKHHIIRLQEVRTHIATATPEGPSVNPDHNGQERLAGDPGVGRVDVEEEAVFAHGGRVEGWLGAMEALDEE